MCARFWLPFLGHCATRGTTRRVVWCSIGRPRGLKLSTERRDRQAWWSNVLMIILRFFLHGVEGAMDRGDGLPAIQHALWIHGRESRGPVVSGTNRDVPGHAGEKAEEDIGDIGFS